MATALSVFIQNQPACAECRFWRQYRCPDPWLHDNTGVCHGCDAARDIREEHDAECPARDIRMLAQASIALRGTLRGVMGVGDAPPSEADPASLYGDSDIHSDYASSYGDGDASFDEEQIMRDHFRICEFCSPFHSTACNGTRTCREMAVHNHALTCQRMTYVCKDMPQSNPRDCPLQARIVALVVRLAGDDERTRR